MNSNQRRSYSKKYIRRLQGIENEYIGAMKIALSDSVDEFITDAQTNGLIAAKNRLDSLIYHTAVTKVIEKLFKRYAFQQAVNTYRELSRQVKKFQRKKDDGDTGAFGFNAEWNSQIIDYLRQYLLRKAVIPVTETTKKIILDVLDQGQQNGWGVERILTELKTQTDELTEMRARRIIRTELGIAGQFGQKMVADSFEFETQKEWIAANDHRTRDSHRKVDGEVIDTDHDFQVPLIKKGVQIGVDLMTGPGDPEAHAENIINCRCTLGYRPKRDESGNLIQKHKKL